MLIGKIWLNYEDEEQSESWEANVTRGIMRDDEIVLEFSGHDPDEGSFSGTCNLRKDGVRYLGPGTFKVGREVITASVSVTMSNEGDVVVLDGTWQDAGDNSIFQLSVELEAG